SGAARSAPDALDYVNQAIDIRNETRNVTVPAGYVLEILATNLDAPRILTFAENGDLFAGSRSGRVYRIPAPYTKAEVFVATGGYPHSVDFYRGEILIAKTEGLYRAPYRRGQARVDSAAVKLWAPLPAGRGHNSRTVRVGPDGEVYVSLGISGNCSDQFLDESYPFAVRRGGVVRLRDLAPQPVWEAFATGLRNPVGFDWHPRTQIMYASNNGPDHLGFELPPESFAELRPNSFHGMPWYQFDGESLRRDECIRSRPPHDIESVSVPVATFPARNAPMGVAFVPAGAMHPSLEYDAVVALRGSWGTQPHGNSGGDPATRRPPKLVVVRFDADKAYRVDDLVTGFQLPDGKRWARPVGVAIGSDGALYFSSNEGVDGLFRLRRR
ncbi:MAG: PQQ-dependent sugar dehydrogenase, partial [Gammaproteobacteria bacterium]|nr:PQQ-dependent sugar dehydrogenase [Gammaproteobacteria bacterium]